MIITSKSIQRSNIIFAFPAEAILKPEPQDVFSLYSPEIAKGSNYIDDPAMEIKIFNFPVLRQKIVFERGRLRVEDETQEEPDISKRAAEAHRIKTVLFKELKPAAFGFNYDIIYRFNDVIPQREIIKNFVSNAEVENVKDFGWQFTLQKEGNKKLETYFFKVVSPLEIALHINHHFDKTEMPPPEKFQELFEKCYNSTDEILKSLNF